MAEYIEREAAIDFIQENQCKKCSDIGLCGGCAVLTAIKLFQTVPAADVAPVRYGRWLEIIAHGGPERLRHEEIYAAVYRCSVCNEEAFDYDYCPNCGAKMQGDYNE